MIMGIDPEAVGKVLSPRRVSWTSKEAILYALGVGAGLDELAFTTENSHGIAHEVLPTYAVIIGQPLNPFKALGEVDLGRLMHGRQGITLHRPIPVDGTVEVTGTITDLQDKGPGKHAIFSVAQHAVDVATGDELVTCDSTFVLRGAGGFGGQRGASTEPVDWPDRAPDHQVVLRPREDQALVYRLSGDRNPLHSDPWFATERAGFPRPILHGLCTYGFAGRALLSAVCAGDVSRFGGMDVRFSSPVFPGETLTTSIWETGDGAVFRTTASPDDRVVLDEGTFACAGH
jgi:acyl dehydratase